ncbi:MAG: hypothetical protein CL440_06900 [Acidimicrobiaceae bacterium]|nr:hypothetical protein [Acidimicrobiaceae bacterium]
MAGGLAYRNSTDYQSSETFAPGAEGVDYRNDFQYRAGDVEHTGELGYRYLRRRYGIFPQQYRNDHDYRSDRLRYRLGVDDPITDTATGVDAQTLTVTVSQADTGAAVEGSPVALSITLEGGGAILEWVTGITEGYELSISSSDTFSVAETEGQGTAVSSSDTASATDAHGISLTQSDAMAIVDALSPVIAAVTQADTASGTEGTAAIALSDSDVGELFDTSLDYQSSTTYQNSSNYRILGEDAKIGVSVSDLIEVLEGLGDRTLTQSEEVDIILSHGIGPIGNVGGPLSLRVDMRYRTNRAGRFPGRMRSRR